MKVTILDYGAGNIQSVQFALARLGIDALLSNDKELILTSDKIIFPGVGHATQAMKQLNAAGLTDLIPELKQDVLGICLGMQLLCKHSEEGDTMGLGVFDAEIKRFSNSVKVPHMGWNTIDNLKSDLFKGINSGAYMYSVHSYYAPLTKQSIAKTSYELPFSAALHHKNFYGVQFHPEKS
ncbi:MAG: imidazole glycerol phosphate synthase subunit HisH, partial [Flavobacteriaceae bacterium]